MATHPLHDEFIGKQRNIALGDRALIAIAAHVEVRSVLRACKELKSHGLDDVLIGSYARKVAIWPGKDVDVFGRLMDETVHSIGPDTAYEMFGRALRPFDADSRLTPQPRSFKIEFGPERYPSAKFIRTAAEEYGWAATRVKRVVANLARLGFEFSVDVVPAVWWDDHYGIPETERTGSTGERHRTGRWRQTDPVKLTEETQARNREPCVVGSGAFVRTVKAIKQVKTYHLPDAKPSSLYYEFLLHEGFKTGDISGDSWADITASALSYIADRLATAETRLVCDPVLHVPYRPVPPGGDLQSASAVFEELDRRARHAVTTDRRCQAAIEWRHVFGGNKRLEDVFPLPAGCRGTGEAMGAAAANLATGGTGEKSFGGC